MRVSGFIALLTVALGCSSTPEGGMDCGQDGSCPDGLTCFPDWRCYAPGSEPDCVPLCWGSEPICDMRTLRCVACVADEDCAPGTICSSPTQRCVPGCSASHPTCKPGESCDLMLGVCRGCNADAECHDPATPHCHADTGQCAPCVPDHDDCPSGQHCVAKDASFACVPGCKDAKECPGGECCNGACVDLASDPSNCGVCGNLCRGGKVCCAGVCADLTSDVENCGKCGNTCLVASVIGPACKSSTCTNEGCESFFDDCDHDPSSGCETNLTMDPNNCYECGRVCVPAPHTVPKCTVSGCVTGPCVDGWSDCDHSSVNGCETAGACP